MKTELKLPKGQILWEIYLKNGEIKYIVTSNELRSRYYLYRVNPDSSMSKIETNNIPSFKEVSILWEGIK